MYCTIALPFAYIISNLNSSVKFVKLNPELYVCADC